MKNNINTINEVIELMGESQLTEITIKEKDFKLVIKKPKLILSETVEVIKEIQPLKETTIKKEVKDIISETVGRFYYIDKNEHPMITLGMSVKKGQNIGYVEAIGLKTEIKSDFDGKISKILVQNGEVAEYGKTLVSLV